VAELGKATAVPEPASPCENVYVATPVVELVVPVTTILARAVVLEPASVMSKKFSPLIVSCKTNLEEVASLDN